MRQMLSLKLVDLDILKKSMIDFHDIVLIINRLSESVQRTCADKTWWEKNIYSQCAKFLNDCILVGNELLEKIEPSKLWVTNFHC